MVWFCFAKKQVQEVVLSADMQCEKCQKRVIDVITKMNGMVINISFIIIK
jgi:copper chaperone CopZ